LKSARTIARPPAVLLALLAVAAALPFALPARAQTALPPAPERWVTDPAGFLSAQTRADLDRRLEAFERSSGGHQIIVWIGDTIGEQSLEDWAARTFEAWGVGRKGLDDGAAIFLLAQDRKIRIEVGYALEDRLTDLRAARIIRDEMTPRLARGDRDGAVTAAVDRVLAAVGGEGSSTPDAQPAAGERQRDRGSLVLFGILGIIFLFLFITNPRMAVYTLLSLSGGGRGGWGGGGGGGWGGGGGFSGGGGRSGGGGASGSW
jgi:uncharacterized protein